MCLQGFSRVKAPANKHCRCVLYPKNEQPLPNLRQTVIGSVEYTDQDGVLQVVPRTSKPSNDVIQVGAVLFACQPRDIFEKKHLRFDFPDNRWQAPKEVAAILVSATQS